MARSDGIWQKVKKTISNEIRDDERLAANLRLLRAVALFAGSVFVMRNFGELMAVLEHMWIKSRFTEKVTEPTRTKDLTAVECPLVKDMYV